MKSSKFLTGLAALAAVVIVGCAQQPMQSGDGALPRYQVDPLWMKAMPDNWIFGQVSSVAVDERDHVLVLHRPNTLHADEKGRHQNPPTNRCCVSAPPVIEYDANGNTVRGWGGPGQGYDWPKQEHGIHVDAQGNGTVTEPRMYQLIRQPQPIADRQFEIEFLDPGVEAYSFTFG